MAINHTGWDGYESYTEPIIHLAREFKPKTILEIGIGHWAFSTTIFLEETTAHLTTIDKGDWGGFGQKYEEELPSRYTFISGRSEIEMPKLIKQKKKYDLIYIDGDHYYEGCKADILNAQQLLAKGGIIVMDDYGVDIMSAVDIDDSGTPINDWFGVKQACDECFTKDKWKVVKTHIPFANGGRAYAKK
jgi:hypothetical protein